MIYQVPEQYFFRLHHPRPRFKNKVESVLIYIASEIRNIGRKPRSEFNALLNTAIRLFPGNATLEEKTINNWRTEISTLFGFIQSDIQTGELYPSRRAVELADSQDLPRLFKSFLFFFQYPGGHIKSHEILPMVTRSIHFKPARFILELLMYAERKEGKRISINKAEVTHCVFNDLRVTQTLENVEDTWTRIKANRENDIEYDWAGDTVRYAGDIMDYMEIANLLESHGENFYINWLEKEAALKFLKDSTWFAGYDMLESLDEIHEQLPYWFDYVNQELPEDFFATDILAFLSSSTEEYGQLRKDYLSIFQQRLNVPEVKVATGEIGDIGENLVHGHECQRLKDGGRQDLVRLVQWIPTAFAMGYDIKSYELDSTQRLIEVKTTISRRELDFTKFHLTPNEWSAAESHGQRYFVYRLLLSKESKKLFLLKDPVDLYKTNKLKMMPRDGAEITFNPETCGEFTPLLEWNG